MDINTLFQSKFIKDAALGALKKAMKANDLTDCVIRYVPQTDDLQFEFHHGENVIIPTKDLHYYADSVKELLKLKSNSNVEL